MTAVERILAGENAKTVDVNGEKVTLTEPKASKAVALHGKLGKAKPGDLALRIPAEAVRICIRDTKLSSDAAVSLLLRAGADRDRLARTAMHLCGILSSKEAPQEDASAADPIST